MEINLKQFRLDEHGHLHNADEWTEELSKAMAKADGLSLLEDHFKIIHAIREIYTITGDTPPMRILIKQLKQKFGEQIDSRVLYRLFPEGPVRFGSKYAGLPKPKHCM